MGLSATKCNQRLVRICSYLVSRGDKGAEDGLQSAVNERCRFESYPEEPNSFSPLICVAH